MRMKCSGQCNVNCSSHFPYKFWVKSLYWNGLVWVGSSLRMWRSVELTPWAWTDGLHYNTSEAKHWPDIIDEKSEAPERLHYALIFTPLSSNRVGIWIKFSSASRSMFFLLIISYPLRDNIPHTENLLIHLPPPKAQECLAHGKCSIKHLSLIAGVCNSWWC